MTLNIMLTFSLQHSLAKNLKLVNCVEFNMCIKRYTYNFKAF